MGGLPDKQVLQERAAAISKAKALLGKDVDPLETFLMISVRQQSRWTIWSAALNFWLGQMWQSLPQAGRTPVAVESSTCALWSTASP